MTRPRYTPIIAGTAGRRVACLICLVLALCLPACQSVPRPAPPRAASADMRRLISRWQAKSQFWRVFQARYRIAVVGPKSKTSFRILVTAQQPENYRVEASNLWGQTYGLLITGKKRSTLWIPSRKVVYSAADSEKLVYRFLGAPISVETLIPLLIGCAPQGQRIQDERPAPGSAAGRIEWTATDGLKSYRWIFRSNPASLESLLISTPKYRYDVSYRPAVPVSSGDVPKEIVVEGKTWRLEVQLQKIKRLNSIDPVLFQFTPPAGVREVFVKT